jgi:hypothetical protein
MGVLTPFFLAGIAAIAGPILFHMIRRTPKGQVPFSTLMFLEPSPPRVTRRSAIEHWLLLLIRSTAVILLAIAFSRPFLRSENEQAMVSQGRRIGILLDVSASMRREGLWEAAVKELNETLAQAKENDSFALFVFDKELIPLVTFEDWKGLDEATRSDFLKKQLDEIEPGWQATDLGNVLPEAVTAVLDQDASEEAAKTTQLVVISDLQKGSRLAGLQAFDWPDSVAIDFRPLKSKTLENAGLQIIGSAEGDSDLRVRIDNSPDSASDAFQIAIEDFSPDRASSPLSPSGERVRVRGQTSKPENAIQLVSHEEPSEPLTLSAQVPAGQNRVVRISEDDLTASATRLTLTGDGETFDNEAWFVRPDPARVTIEYYGEGATDEPNELRYYIERAFLPTPTREIDFVVASDGPTFASAHAALTIVAQPLDAEQLKQLQGEIRDGRHVVVVGETAEICGLAFGLAERAVPEIVEASVDSYAMLSDVDLDHPLFSVFNDVRLADFSKLPIWKHRECQVTESKAIVLAKYDSGSPAIVEFENKKGTVTLFTFGWHAADSRFVLWSKFVPVVNSLLERVEGTAPPPSRLTVGDLLPLSILGDTKMFRITDPSGLIRDIDTGPGEAARIPTSEPGIYSVSWTTDSGPRKSLFAVNLDPLESRTSPLGLDELAAIGVPLANAAGEEPSVEEKRQLQSRELEASQRVWQWLILAGLLLLLLETWLAGRTAESQGLVTEESA